MPLQRSDFHFDLPEELIAQQPSAERGGSRLLCLDRHSGELADKQFSDFLGMINEQDLLVFNNTKVIPARVFGQKASGGKIEILLERILDEQCFLAHVRASKSPKPGSELLLEQGVKAEVLGREDALFLLRFDDPRSAFEIFEAIGHIPLPPYIQRSDSEQDAERYQTVYAQERGAVAAPTAGLHFSEQHLQNLQQRGIQTAFVTLHVGAGTFQPVRVDDLATHIMHSEYAEVSEEVCAAVAAARERGGRVIAIGTTSVRALESASQSGQLTPYRGDTRLFITPGYEFRSVDALLTNFHLPESTLLMLVSAFTSLDSTLNAYRHAVAQGYRFFSYGDAMFIC